MFMFVLEQPPDKFFEPPYDIGANYYPLLGPYSSADPIIIHEHAKQVFS